MTTPYELGYRNALLNAGLLKQSSMITPGTDKLLAYAVPSLVGGALGAGTGAIAAPEGQGGRGALTGALGGAALGLAGAHAGLRTPALIEKLRGAQRYGVPSLDAGIHGILIGGPAGMTAGGIGGGLLGQHLGREKSRWEKIKDAFGG